MATDIIDPPIGFRAELIDAIKLLDPQIDGLGDLRLASISEEARDVVAKAVDDRTRRRALIQAVIAALDNVIVAWNNLKHDGYPVVPQVTAQTVLFDELRAEADAIALAMKVFEPTLPATKISLDLGGISPKEP